MSSAIETPVKAGAKRKMSDPPSSVAPGTTSHATKAKPPAAAAAAATAAAAAEPVDQKTNGKEGDSGGKRQRTATSAAPLSRQRRLAKDILDRFGKYSMTHEEYIKAGSPSKPPPSMCVPNAALRDRIETIIQRGRQRMNEALAAKKKDKFFVSGAIVSVVRERSEKGVTSGLSHSSSNMFNTIKSMRIPLSSVVPGTTATWETLDAKDVPKTRDACAVCRGKRLVLPQKLMCVFPEQHRGVSDTRCDMKTELPSFVDAPVAESARYTCDMLGCALKTCSSQCGDVLKKAYPIHRWTDSCADESYVSTIGSDIDASSEPESSDQGEDESDEDEDHDDDEDL